MKIRGVVGLVLAMAGTACGPMPGYVDPDREAATPAAPPAPAPHTKITDDRDGPDDEDEREQIAERRDVEQPDEAEQERPPRPPRYAPPPRYTPPTERTPRYTPPMREPVQEPPAELPEPLPPVPAAVVKPQEKVRKVSIDEDTYYLLDPVRKLCFLRHKDTMTSLDCARIPEARDFADEPVAPVPLPAAPAEPKLPEPARVSRTPEPAPAKSGAPTADETARFEGAFVDIFCDRKGGDDVSPDQRITDRGLSVERYTALEGWWANDEKAWWTLTDKARKACPQR